MHRPPERTRAGPQAGERTGKTAGLMLVRVFTLGFDPATERFDDTPVRDFISDKDVESISDHFFVRDGVPYQALAGLLKSRAAESLQPTPPQNRTRGTAASGSR